MESSYRIKFSLSRKFSGYELPAISKWHNITGDLCRNYAGRNNLKINICFRRKFIKQKLESWNLTAEA
ncbi:hypothetical protein EKM03_14555 [Flavobacterium sp. GSP6]|nr:hypothetical protein EKM03_14555 [Flavobacterium sp. GSP6]